MCQASLGYWLAGLAGLLPTPSSTFAQAFPLSAQLLHLWWRVDVYALHSHSEPQILSALRRPFLYGPGRLGAAHLRCVGVVGIVRALQLVAKVRVLREPCC